MLRQQMAEFHGEMSSAQSKISLALPRSHCPHCQQTIRIRDNIPLFSADAQRALPRLSGENQQALSAGGVIDSTCFFAGESGLARKWMGAGGDDIIRRLIAASVIDLDHQWLPDVFTQGVLWTGLIAAWAQQSPLTLQDAVTGVWWDLSLLLSALDSRNSSA